MLLGLAAISGTPAAWALGLGDLVVETNLGRPFSATIPLLVGKGEKWRGLCRSEITPVRGPIALEKPDFRLEEQDGSPRLRITTVAAVMEPAVEFRLRLVCEPGNVAVRDYLVFLDPAGYPQAVMPEEEPARATPVTAVPRRDEPYRTAPTAAKPGPPVKRKTKALSKPPLADPPRIKGYRNIDVLPGDSLQGIVSDIYTGGEVERDAITAAIISANPKAFPGGDPDILLEGTVLKVPDTGAWDDGYGEEVEPLAVSGERPVEEAESRGRRSLIRPAAEEPRRLSLKMGWVLLDEGRVETARLAAEDRLSRPYGSGEAATTADAGFTETAQFPKTKGRESAGAEKDGDSAVAATEKLAAAEVRIKELNRELLLLKTRLATRYRPPVPSGTVKRSTATGLTARFPWYVWLGLIMALSMLVAGFLQLRRRPAFPLPESPVAEEPVWSGLQTGRELPPRKTRDLPMKEPVRSVEEQRRRPVRPEDLSGVREPAAGPDRETEVVIPLDLGVSGVSDAMGGEETLTPAEDMEAMQKTLTHLPDAGSGKKKLQVGEQETEKVLRSVPAAMLEVELHFLYEQPEKAVSILKSLVDRDNEGKADTRPWTMLFNIYRKMDQREMFDELADRFRRRYNVMAPEWVCDAREEGETGLEDKFPHVLEKIGTVWGTTEALETLNDLLLDDRNGERRGFDLNAAEDILLLRGILYELAASTPQT